MKNIRLKIEYDGTDYQGWQTQRLIQPERKPQKTIQETIENVLKRVLQEKVKLTGSGRTDAGVHARAQTANFKTASNLPLKTLKTAFNSLLPPDIRIKNVQEVSSEFHARYLAKSKVYRYTIFNRSEASVFLRNYAWHVIYPLDVDLMRQECRTLLGKHDFKSFQTCDRENKNSTRTIEKIIISKHGSIILIDIFADGFLYNMARNIVGTLVEIGRGKLEPGSLRKILAAKDRRKAGPTAPAKGLCLLKVNY